MCTQLLLLGFPYQHAGIEFDFLLCVCHKEVAEANFALHETHCSRFLCLCPECDEAVPRDQLAEHKEDIWAAGMEFQLLQTFGILSHVYPSVYI
uniref:XIAP associated factor 1 n=1 Tax=Acanthochromis polyacanthus TaxID=80966 RepID=A0A3Q1F114_9TELE